MSSVRELLEARRAEIEAEMQPLLKEHHLYQPSEGLTLF